MKTLTNAISMKKYQPNVSTGDLFNVQGYTVAQIMALVLKNCGDDLSRENIVRQAANLRTDPHGSTIRVLPQGTPLHVFGQASGGWYQVGDTAPWGWVHESMLNKGQ